MSVGAWRAFARGGLRDAGGDGRKNRQSRAGVVPPMRLICTLIASGAVALLATASASSMAPPRLVGTVGPGFTISLKHNGKVFKTLKHGRYTFAISDKANIHNFQIEGPGVDRAITTVSFKGAKTVTIMLRKGSYKFYCAPHESGMFGRFKVT